MRAVVQRVARASVTVEGTVVGEIGAGLLVLLGVTHTDTIATADRLGDKITGLRIFEDADGKMNLALADTGGALLCVSQFTLHGDMRRGRRPSFEAAAPPAVAEQLYERFCATVRAQGISCEHGVFGAHMAVDLLNDGPVTLIIDTDELDRPRR
ncbi:MAG: D-aminoacyl-tRNA deacylase [Dehalococcoidia bacterium]